LYLLQKKKNREKKKSQESRQRQGMSNGWEENLRSSNISDSDISEGGNSTDNQTPQERK
jgi:hypothetical protein